jgi:hypothetical protein
VRAFRVLASRYRCAEAMDARCSWCLRQCRWSMSETFFSVFEWADNKRQREMDL